MKPNEYKVPVKGLLTAYLVTYVCFVAFFGRMRRDRPCLYRRMTSIGSSGGPFSSASAMLFLLRIGVWFFIYHDLMAA
jgi:hypothetical protein